MQNILSKVFFYFTLLLIILLILIQLKPAQVYLAQKAVKIISKSIHHDVEIEGVGISWLDRIKLKNLLIKDENRDTLIYINSVDVNYKLWDLMKFNFKEFEEVNTDGLVIKIIKEKGAKKYNINTFFDTFRSENNNSDSTKILLGVSQAILENSRILIENRNKPKKTSGFDENYLDLRAPSIDVLNFVFENKKLKGNVIDCSLKEEYTDYEIKKCKTLFEISQEAMIFSALDLKTKKSSIRDSIAFYYNTYTDLAYFLDSVKFAVKFNNTFLHQDDINFFANSKLVDKEIAIEGNLWGGYSDFNLEEATIGFGRETFFRGGISCFGLPDLSSTFILADINQSIIHIPDFEWYLGQFYDKFDDIENVRFKGSFAGFMKDFVAKGIFESRQGRVVTDINFKIPNENVKQSKYSGHLEFSGLDVGEILGVKELGKMNLKGEIKGKGLTKHIAKFNLDAKLTNSDINQYKYDSIDLKGNFSEGFFDGFLNIHDKNCRVAGDAKIDLNHPKGESFNIDLKVKKMHLDSLNLSKKPLFISGDINLNFNNYLIDEIIGKAHIDSAKIVYNKKEITLDSIFLTSNFEQDSIRNIDFQMKGINANAKGKFRFKDIFNDIPLVLNNYAYLLNISQDSILPNSVIHDRIYALSTKINITKIDYLMKMLDIPLHIPSDLKMEANFRKSKQMYLSLFADTDSLNYDGYSFKKPKIEISSSKDINSNDVLTSFFVEIAEQKLRKTPKIMNTQIEGVWNTDEIDLSLYLTQPSTSSKLDIQGIATLTSDFLKFKFNPSRILLFNEKWQFDPKNQLYVNPHTSKIDHLGLFREKEYIGVNAIHSDSTISYLKVKSNKLNLNKLNLFSSYKFDGFLDANFDIFKKANQQNVRSNGIFKIEKFAIDSLEFGDFEMKSVWDTEKKQMQLTANLKNNNQKTLNLEGTYTPDKVDNSLDITAKLTNQELKPLNIFFEGLFSNFNATATGDLLLNGSFKKPVFSGDFAIKNGFLNFDYLKTPYKFNGDLLFTNKKIQFKKFNIIDRKDALATLSGKITHDFFKNFYTSLTINATNVECLNTTKKDNSLFYGNAYASGTVDVTGPFNDILVKCNLETENNTRFFIPVEPDNTVEKSEFISFVNLSDSTKNTENQAKKDYETYVTLDFDISVTPDAYCEMIFDPKIGDIIRGRGRGDLKIKMNKEQDLTMFGELEIEQGGYNFVVPGFISKEFKIQTGSKIAWYGDPFNATLGIKAAYEQRASFEQLESVDNQNAALLSNKETIVVILKIDGEMMSPEIGFDLQTKGGGLGVGNGATELAQIKSDEQELRRQVISLLFLKKFSPRRSFAIGQANVGRSVSEFFSNQMSYLISQIDENLEVEIDFATLDDDSFNVLQLRLAYTFLDGRLKISRGGGIGTSTGADNEKLGNLIGDWALEYVLTQNGKLRIKAFSNSRNDITSSNKFIQETGLGLLFIHSFNNFKELITLSREKAIKNKN